MKQAGMPWRPLAALTVAVLAMHLVALRPSPGAVQFQPPRMATNSFIIRSIDAKPPPAAPAPAPVSAPVLEKKVTIARIPYAPTATTLVAEHAPAVASVREPGLPATAFTIPGSVRLRYEVAAKSHGMEWRGQAELFWHHDGDNYDAKLEVSAAFLPARIQRSTGRITAEGLAPTRFSDKARSEEAAHFERDKGKLSFSSNRPDVPLLTGAQDRLSVLLQLGAMIAGEPSKYPVGTSLIVQTASAREADQWLFTVEGEEDLQLPGGPVKALKLIRNPRKEFDQKVELWLAPDMDYVVVRLRLTQPNGDWLDLQWSTTDRG